MQKILIVAHLGLLLAGIALCVEGAILARQASALLSQVAKDEAAASKQVASDHAAVVAAIKSQSGAVASLKKATLDAVAAEKGYWDQNNQKVGSLLTNASNAAEMLTGAAGDTRIAISDLDVAIADLDARVNDPNITATLANINKITWEAGQTAEHVHITAMHVESMSTDIQQYVHRVTRPASFIKQLAMSALDVGSKVTLIVNGKP